VLETTALGAAYLAGLTVGLWRSRDEIAAQQAIERRFEPQMSRALAAELMGRWREAVARSRRWVESA
jgi:glycerol kinase